MPPISEIAFVGFTLVTSVSSWALLGSAPPQDVEALQWLLLPLIGALLASVAAFLLNPYPEARKAVLGRGIIGVFAGTVLPTVISMFHPALANLASHPALKLLSGFSICLLVYILAKPFVTSFYKRSGAIGDELANVAQKKISEVTITKTETKLEQ